MHLTKRQRDALRFALVGDDQKLAISTWSSRVLHGLENKGLIERIDGTWGYYRITETGRKIASELI